MAGADRRRALVRGAARVAATGARGARGRCVRLLLHARLRQPRARGRWARVRVQERLWRDHYVVPEDLRGPLTSALMLAHASGIKAGRAERWLGAPLQLAHDVAALWAGLHREPARLKTDGELSARLAELCRRCHHSTCSAPAMRSSSGEWMPHSRCSAKQSCLRVAARRREAGGRPGASWSRRASWRLRWRSRRIGSAPGSSTTSQETCTTPLEGHYSKRSRTAARCRWRRSAQRSEAWSRRPDGRARSARLDDASRAARPAALSGSWASSRLVSTLMASRRRCGSATRPGLRTRSAKPGRRGPAGCLPGQLRGRSAGAANARRAAAARARV